MESSLQNALIWLVVLVSGPVAMGFGVVAVSLLGFATLGGYLDTRRAARVLIGLCLLFAAPSLSLALWSGILVENSASYELNGKTADPAPQAICWTCG